MVWFKFNISYSIGINGSTLWHSVPSSSIHSFYIGGGEIIRFNFTGVGFANTNPQSYMHLGNCDVAGSSPVLLFGKRLANSEQNLLVITYNDSFSFCVGDAGNVNSSVVTVQQFQMSYAGSSGSLSIGSSGYVTMPFKYGRSSDERVQTNTRIIENA